MRLPMRFFVITIVLLTSLLLAACSSLIAPQTLSDPIRVKGQRVQVEIGASGNLQTAAAGHGFLSSSFDDIDTSSSPIAVNISQGLFKLGFAVETLLDSPATVLPCGITLTDVSIDITLSDSLQTLALPTFKVNKLIELEQNKDNPNRYSIMTKDAFIGIVLSGQDATDLQKIITTGGTNEVVIRVSIQTTSIPELPPGSLLILTFETSEATLTF
jgi:hypothetical protein